MRPGKGDVICLIRSMPGRRCATTSDLSETLFSLVKKCSFFYFSSCAAVYILPTNVLPHRTALVACWSRPTKESISRFVAFFFSSQVDKVSLIRTSLSSGSQISIRTVSNSIPRKEIVVDSPSTFSSAI